MNENHTSTHEGSPLGSCDNTSHGIAQGISPSRDPVVDYWERQGRIPARPRTNAFVRTQFTADEVNWADQVTRSRPQPHRSFDQINMRAGDLLRHATYIAAHLQDKSVAFVGDMDGVAMLLGILGANGQPCPSRMLLLDFDQRILIRARDFARAHGFDGILSIRPYNVFNPIPPDLVATFDWFHTNPPYGQYNEGESARLFITRGSELCVPDRPNGCIILPDDHERPWTQTAWRRTRASLTVHGWRLRGRIDGAHRYHLDDDSELTSCLFLVQRCTRKGAPHPAMPYSARRVEFHEIPDFYGRQNKPPYPDYIREDGQFEYDGDTQLGTRA